MPRVTVSQPSVIKVEVGNRSTTVQSINYGSRTLKGASDLVMSGAQSGDVIIFDSANNDFRVTSVQSAITDIDAGLF